MAGTRGVQPSITPGPRPSARDPFHRAGKGLPDGRLIQQQQRAGIDGRSDDDLRADGDPRFPQGRPQYEQDGRLYIVRNLVDNSYRPWGVLVHRLNKDKQDLLLPHVEDGSIILIGATTANPYHAINPAIRSRCHLFEFKPLEREDVKEGILHALKAEEGLNGQYTIEEDALDLICDTVNGDIRWALNLLEISAILSKDGKITADIVRENCHNVNNRSFGSDDGHYDLLSALQKSIRGSDVNAALYYLALLAQSGDVESISRRLLVIAYEDVGLANPQVASRTIAAVDAAEHVGFPEAIIPLGVHIIDLCLSPKSRTGVDAVHQAEAIVATKAYDMPKYLKLTPVGLNKEEQYSYDRYDCFHRIRYLPEELKDLDLFPSFNPNRYEQQLKQIYEELKKTPRTGDLRNLYR